MPLTEEGLGVELPPPWLAELCLASEQCGRRERHYSAGAFSCSNPRDRICKRGYYCAEGLKLTCVLDPSSVSPGCCMVLVQRQEPDHCRLSPHPLQTTKASGENWGTAMGRSTKNPAIHLAKGTLILINDMYFG